MFWGSLAEHGGVAVFVKSELAPAFELVRRDTSLAGLEVVWLRVRAAALANEGRGLLIGACYAAPEDSRAYEDGGGSAEAREATAAAVTNRLQGTVAELQRGNDLLLVGDFNARLASSASVADVPDLALLAAAREQLGAAAGPDPAAYTGVPSERASLDSTTNATGRALGELCRSYGLVVLNGRAPGDTAGAFTCPRRGDGGGSLIDLCLVSPQLYSRVDRLEVGGDYQRPAASSRSQRRVAASGGSIQRYSDHRPVSLTLQLRVSAPTQTPPPGGATGKPPRFKVSDWRRYSAAFAADDAPTLTELGAVTAALASGAIGSTAAVEGISKVVARELASAFGRRRPAGLRAEHAPWWDEACVTAHAALVQRAEERSLGQGSDASFRAARAAWDRARRQAKAKHDADTYRAFVSTCRADPTALWNALNKGQRKGCGLASAAAAREHFKQQHGEADPALAAPGPTDSMLSFIAGAEQPNAAGPGGSVRW
ncbi:hypothetical protein HYH03_000645 [Edaphochlamys debaryana]|uniref:Endonuclease/exonuclease/phosphatase domain-containing protein n=1 Tax=Edaphochlamys debaryana TaxID=47281 RepID=A0A835YG92_9CHLO|nr:hypothetical protein HYH03_000645 [Edaphochlamys debaryana]|eukprot:KAG2502158.1 hypothetical protein HYH03_000645 [Edaphochlamys debaryana]